MARLIDDRFTYLQTTELQIDEIDEVILELRSRAEQGDVEVRARCHSELERLEACRRHAVARCREMRHVDPVRWQRMRPAVEAVWVEIKEVTEHARWGV